MSEVLSFALSENTRVAYAKGWRCFQDYCASRRINALNATPDNVSDFLIHLSSTPRASDGDNEIWRTPVHGHD